MSRIARIGVTVALFLTALTAASATPPSRPPRLALDIERLRAVPAGRFPNDEPTAQVLVVGGGLGGVAAAEDLLRQGVSVILTEPTSHLGGQLTAQELGVPDENRFIEQIPGPGTRHYREIRDQVRSYYAALSGVLPKRADNVGQCWVSRVSGEPVVWEEAVFDRLIPYAGPHGLLRVLMRSQLLDVQRYTGNGQFAYADFLDLDTGRITRVGAQFLLDATETGDALPLAGVPWTLGQEARDVYGEPDAPPDPHPEWVQRFTYDFLVRWTPDGPRPIIERPAEYDHFRSLGEYTLAYEYSNPPRTVLYKMLVKVAGAGGPFWTYRRLLAASSFTPAGREDDPGLAQDLAVINWRGNDFGEENPVGKTVPEQVRILTRARAFAQGFLYWLQTECPRDDGGTGYPEIQPDPDAIGADGFAPQPYFRESRRLVPVFPLTENAMLPPPGQPDQKLGTEFFDSVGVALYNIDIHPAPGEPPLLTQVLPYHLPLGAFLAASGPTNVLPSGKDLGASRLAAASARTHPIEWLVGEIAGHLAAFCLKEDVAPAQVRDTPALLAAFQARLEQDGITTRWSEVAGAP